MNVFPTYRPGSSINGHPATKDEHQIAGNKSSPVADGLVIQDYGAFV
jgi:hypothetical protein